MYHTKMLKYAKIKTNSGSSLKKKLKRNLIIGRFNFKWLSVVMTK